MKIIHFFFFGLGIFLLNSCKSNTYQVQSALILKNLETENKLYQSASKHLIWQLENIFERKYLGDFELRDTFSQIFEPLSFAQAVWADTATAHKFSGKNLLARYPNVQHLGQDISKLKQRISACNEQFFLHCGLDTSKKTERAYYQPRIDTFLQTAFSALQTPLFEFENLDAEALQVSLAIFKTEIFRVHTELLQMYLFICQFRHGYNFAELVFFPADFYEIKDSISFNIDLLYSNQHYSLDTLEIYGRRFAYTDNKQLFKLRTDKIGEQIVSVKAYYLDNIFGESITFSQDFMYEVTP
jgi:hypothetical protein